MTQATLGFSATIADRTRDFTGRERVFAEIDGWLAQSRSHVFLLAGEPGIGKTAIATRPAGSGGWQRSSNNTG